MQVVSYSSLLIFKSFAYLTLVSIVCCLYDDQVGKFDWRQQYIGKVKFAYIDPVSASTHKFVVATEKNVLACLSTRTGSIIWRQILEKGETGEVTAMSEEGELITINGDDAFIRIWDLNSGVLQEETPYPHEINQFTHRYHKINYVSKKAVQIYMDESTKLASLSVYGFIRGANTFKSVGIDAPWYTKNTNCSFISSNFFACIQKDKKILHLLSVKNGGAFTSVPLLSLGIEIADSIRKIDVISVPYQESSDKPVFGIQLDDSVMIMQIQLPGIKLLKILLHVTAITSTMVENKLTVFSLTYAEKIYKIKALDVEAKEELPNLAGLFSLSEDRGNLEHFFILPYVKKDHGVSYKSLLLFEDHSMLVIHQQGRIVWSREEALSSIVSAEIMDLPLSEMDANIEQEFGHPDAGLISMFLTRLKSQVYLLQTFLLKTLIGFKGDGDIDGSDKKPLSRDTFGLHKIIVIITKPGKVFGIDNFSGLIIWSHFERYFSPFSLREKPYFPLYVQRTTAHFPYPPVCTALGRHSITEKSLIFSFDPITGVTLESKTLPYDVLQVMPVGTLTNYLRELLIMDHNLKVHIYPESHDISKHRSTHFMFTSDPSSGILEGYALSSSDSADILKANKIWKVVLPQKIVEVISKKLLEHVHSQGRVMGDRSVLYKYLNPNLAVVFTEGHDVIQKSFCNIYLIDIITGLIVYSASHKRCNGPIHIVHSENWVVYSFYSDKSRRIEISSIELFEGMYQSNTTAFSSFAPPPLPLVEHQTFIFPSTIEVMADTVTERGMTSKHILIALPSGGILELPKTFLDPRRPINPLPEHREEGLIPYIPELPIVSESIVNYNQSVMHVEGIVTAPSGLESTCLVFVHGLDLFYTRVTPSKTFDILKDDFDHSFICVVLLGLLVISYISKRFAARRTLRAAWK